MKRVKKLALVVFLVAALTSTAIAIAASHQRLSAHLTARVEVPKPIGKTKKATGAFTAAYTVHAKSLQLKWKLSFKHLTSTATAATLRKGKPGYIGEQVTILCKPCKSGGGATTLMRKSVLKTLRSGQLFVMIYTKRNPAGEIRGQIRFKG